MKYKLLPPTAVVIALVLALACAGSEESSGRGAAPSPGASAAAANATPVPTQSTASNGAVPVPPKGTIEQLVLIQPNDNQTSLKLNNGQLAVPPPSTSELTLAPTGIVDALGLQALYKLSPPAEGGIRSAWVETTFMFGNTELSRSAQVNELGKWSFMFPFGSEAHPPNGDYEIVVKLLPSGDRKSVKFRVSGAPETAAKLEPAILVSQAIIAKGDVFVTNYQGMAKTSFSATDNIFLLTSVSTAAPVPSVVLTASWQRNGQEIAKPQTSINTVYTGLREFPFPGPKAPGDYEVTVRVPSTGESTKVGFKILPADPAPGSIKEAGVIKGISRTLTPQSSDFVSSLSANDSILLAFSLSSGADIKDVGSLFRSSTLYEGIEVRGSVRPDVRGAWLVNNIHDASVLPGFFPAGRYETIVSNDLTGEKKSVKYTVASDGTIPPVPAKIANAAVAEVSLNPTGTPVAAYKSTIAPGASAIAVYYTMDTKGGDSAIKATWTLPNGNILSDGGTAIMKPGATQNFSIKPSPADGGVFVPGDYQVTLTVVTTGDVKVYKFTVK